MPGLEWLHDCAGRWAGNNRLNDPVSGSVVESPSTATVQPVLHDRFVRVDYTWRYDGRPQEGALLVGFEAREEVVTIHWIDTWHMSDKVMALRGSVGDGSSLSTRGSYAAPDSPDWGWRIDLRREGETLRLIMHNISPDGHEAFAVDAAYTRSR